MKFFYRKGDSAEFIKTIQQKLKSLRYKITVIDGDYGSETEKAITLFQKSKKLNADGVVGPITLQQLGLQPITSQVIPVPVGKEAIYEMFGDPLEPGYWEFYGGFCVTPPELNHCFTYTFNSENGFWCNKLLIPKFQGVYSAIVKRGLGNELKSFDGCYNLRYKRGIKRLSTHSWGIAVDHNAFENKLGTEGNMHPGIVKAFEDYNFYWGGNFGGRKDPMHLQYAKGF